MNLKKTGESIISYLQQSFLHHDLTVDSSTLIWQNSTQLLFVEGE